MSAVKDPPRTNRSRKVPCPTRGWLTSGTIAVLELNSTSLSPFVLNGSEMVADVDGVRLERSLEVNDVRGDEW